MGQPTPEIAPPCLHVWMPPRAGGIPAYGALQGDRSIRVPGGQIVTFPVLIASDPEHCWTGRWCLGCRAPHPKDAAARYNAGSQDTER